MYQQPFSVSLSNEDIHIPASILVVSSVMTPQTYVIQKQCELMCNIRQT